MILVFIVLGTFSSEDWGIRLKIVYYFLTNYRIVLILLIIHTDMS